MSSRPNFLVFMADQHAARALGAAGHPAVRTPCLDRLAREGVTFSAAYATYPMCTPARASFMTGLYTPQHGVWELGDPLSSALPTWAHALNRAGYETILSGRMHFVGPDQRHGFHRLAADEMGHAQGRSPIYAYAQWDSPDPARHVMHSAVLAAGPTETETEYQRYDRGVCDAARREIRQRLAKRGNQPWAMVVGLMNPHFPYRISRPYYDLYRDADIPLPARPPDGRSFDERLPEAFRRLHDFVGVPEAALSAEQIREARRCYYAMISFVDEQVGSVVAELEQCGLAENTWVMYLGDHGESLGEHGLWSKMVFFEDSVRIPWIIRAPNVSRAGAACPAPVSQVDWLPTVLDVTGQSYEVEPLPGRSLRPLLDNPAETWPERAVFSDYASRGTDRPGRMVRRGRWKGCFQDEAPPVLFDLQADPHEWSDRANEESLQPVLDELAACARADGWDPRRLRAEILRHQRRLRYIAESHSTGHEE